ncbi:daunorubicin resistance protein DrrA family ABC transporter ATP-binding protein [Kibdelosporangium aridum]|uniref:Daunorubicin resistance protein DrrA family ABC transporter ATP-binding protein n=1 Tax=Kibdelosporangium aridum TaxID=2030 RepID=A0A428YZ65_KIBAR|nr:daunorubicin resistance protein DrrA family ABC transporter ATP-binding protein [Kibdelosporangium aridum]RSM76735.1 daunorubicin resistance protein DrrA family ABC transporter ATP-binding protein [Kibdelosporangium aridum]
MIVEVEGLKKAYGDNVVLAGIDLHVPEGSVYALLGPNGAGKTTTVRILTTLTRPDAGKVLVAGHDVVREQAKVRAEISLTGQHAAVDNEQTGRENLVMTGQLMHLGRAAARRRADQLLERFDLLDAMHRRVKTYSGGMRRRLDLAMSLVAEPRLIFLDEPTTGLDPASRTTMWDAIKELVRAGTTVVLTTQYLEEADRLADWIVLINKGDVAMSGTADSLKAQVGGERMELTFDDESGVLRAAELLGGQVNRERRVLDLSSDGTAAHVHSVLNHLAAFRISVARVSSHRPTLDDVFMAVTADRPREGANA